MQPQQGMQYGAMQAQLQQPMQQMEYGQQYQPATPQPMAQEAQPAQQPMEQPAAPMQPAAVEKDELGVPAFLRRPTRK